MIPERLETRTEARCEHISGTAQANCYNQDESIRIYYSLQSWKIHIATFLEG
jgi:hypothetical protein